MIFQLLAAALGVGIMTVPAILTVQGPLANADWIVGPTVAALGLISASGALRALRRMNIANAGALLLAGLIWGRGVVLSTHVALALAILLLSIPRGRIRQRYGSGWMGLFSRREVPVEEVS